MSNNNDKTEKYLKEDEFNEEYLNRIKRIKVLNYLLMAIAFIFVITGLITYILFKFQYGEIHNIQIGEWVNDVLVYSIQPDYAYTRLIVALIFSLFLYAITESNLILNGVYETVKEVLEDNKE